MIRFADIGCGFGGLLIRCGLDISDSHNRCRTVFHVDAASHPLTAILITAATQCSMLVPLLTPSLHGTGWLPSTRTR